MVVALFLCLTAACSAMGAQTASAATPAAPASPPATYGNAVPAPIPAPDGKAIFADHCAICHGDAGQGSSAVTTIVGPSLQAEHQYGDVMAAMERGPSHMPNFTYILTVAEMRAVATYVTRQIAVVPLTGGDLSEGGKLFRIYCAACHRTLARGGALAFTGVNAPAIVDKSPALIAGAIRLGPGPMPSFSSAVLSDQQVASIVDYVKFARTPPSPGGTPARFYGPSAEGFIGFAALGLLMLLAWWIEKGGKG